MSAVSEMTARLGTNDEADILRLASAARTNDIELLAVAPTDRMPPDTVEESELIEASPLPLPRAQREVLIRSSLVNEGRKPTQKVKASQTLYAVGNCVTCGDTFYRAPKCRYCPQRSRFVCRHKVAVGFRTPHFEHLRREITAASVMSQPAIRAKVSGSASRVWPQRHLRTTRYWPA